MKEKYVKCLIVIVVVSLMGIFIYQNINKENKPLPEVKLKEIVNNNKSFAIMIQEKSETDKYQEYNSNTWPGDDYVFKEAKCIDNNGDEIKEAVTYENDKITLTTNKTVYCTVYFDKSIIGKLRENDTQKYLSEDKQGEMYRYQASFPECDNESECENATKMTNWICFGTEENCGTNDDNIDKYMYRIMGVTKEGQLYLLKETVLKGGETNSFAWNSKSALMVCLGETCEWPNVDLYKRLNGETSNGNPIFINNSEYEYMVEGNEWYKLIADHNWMYGDTDDNISNYNGNKMYAIETGKVATKRYWPDEDTQTTCSDDSPCTEKDYTWSTEKSVNAKIGLMYMHDVDYAYIGGNSMGYTNNKNSWIHFRKDGYNTSNDSEWLITRFGVRSTNGTGVCARVGAYHGGMYDSFLYSSTGNGARPVFYLKSSTKIADGSGTKTDPYIINL